MTPLLPSEAIAASKQPDFTLKLETSIIYIWDEVSRCT